MNTLSMFFMDTGWVIISSVFINIFCMYLVLLTKKQEKKGKYNLIDCYHLFSRASYVRTDTMKFIPEGKSREIYKRWRTLVKVGEVKYHENKYGYFESGDKIKLYGTIYRDPC